MRRNFPTAASKPLAAHHIALWDWLEALQPGVKPDPIVVCIARGGGKSTTVELGTTFVGQRLTRKFALIVSGTQDQADKRVGAISSWFERLGIERSVNIYGHSKGWRRNMLRTATGFNVQSIGLDVAARGVKLDEFRPDLIVFDDVDDHTDSGKVAQKKVEAITHSIIPAGSSDCAVLAVQNLIREDGFMGRLVSGEADYLTRRQLIGPVPAAYNLTVEPREIEGGRRVWAVTGGEPTWAGQPLETIEAQINEQGLVAFLRESQHELSASGGTFFHVDRIRIIDETPAGITRWCRAWDLAATEGAGDWTVGVLAGKHPGGIHIEDVARGQWSGETVQAQLKRTAESDAETYGYVTTRIPQDPGAAGKILAGTLRRLLSGYPVRIVPVTGDKATRAAGLQNSVNLGEVTLKRAPWNQAFLAELRRFREDLGHAHDDQVDAAADAVNELNPPSYNPFGFSGADLV